LRIATGKELEDYGRLARRARPSPAIARNLVSKIYSGACICGAVQVEVSGQPEAMGYCGFVTAIRACGLADSSVAKGMKKMTKEKMIAA
jgi:hypothetical protein